MEGFNRRLSARWLSFKIKSPFHRKAIHEVIAVNSLVIPANAFPESLDGDTTIPDRRKSEGDAITRKGSDELRSNAETKKKSTPIKRFQFDHGHNHGISIPFTTSIDCMESFFERLIDENSEADDFSEKVAKYFVEGSTFMYEKREDISVSKRGIS